MKSRHGDHAFTAPSLYGTQVEHTYAGALSFLRRRYTRDLDGVDVAVTGIPFDLATTNRPGTRFGPAGIRAASAHLAWGPPWPWGFDPTERLAIIDYGDCAFDFGRPEGIPAQIEAHAKTIIDAGTSDPDLQQVTELEVMQKEKDKPPIAILLNKEGTKVILTPYLETDAPSHAAPKYLSLIHISEPTRRS